MSCLNQSSIPGGVEELCQRKKKNEVILLK